MLRIFDLLHFLIVSLFSWLSHSDIYISARKESPAVFSKIVTAIKEDRICLARARKKLHDRQRD